MYGGQAAPPKHTQVKYIEEPEEPRFSAGGIVAHAVIDEPIRIGHEQGERYFNLWAYIKVVIWGTNCHFKVSVKKSTNHDSKQKYATCTKHEKTRESQATAGFAFGPDWLKRMAYFLWLVGLEHTAREHNKCIHVSKTNNVLSTDNKKAFIKAESNDVNSRFLWVRLIAR